MTDNKQNDQGGATKTGAGEQVQKPVDHPAETKTTTKESTTTTKAPQPDSNNK